VGSCCSLAEKNNRTATISRNGEIAMHIFTKIYEFAASAGAFEGYVYRKEEVGMEAISNWVDNLVSAYQSMSPETLDEIQISLDKTIGRAIRSLMPLLGEGHEIIRRLGSMVSGALPATADDFQKVKWFDES
jgi:hypothetical protein